MTLPSPSLPLHHDDVPHHLEEQQQQQQQQQRSNLLAQLHPLPYAGHLLLVAAVMFSLGYLSASPRSTILEPHPVRSEHFQSEDFSQADAYGIDTSTVARVQQSVSPRLLNSSPSEQLSNDTCATPIGVQLPPSSSSSTTEPLTAVPEWVPVPNRYLMLSCTNGGSTNRLLCFQKTSLAAILLNRTLLVPEVPLCVPRSLGRPVVYSDILDIGRLSRCFGDPENGADQPPRKVISGLEFSKLKGGNGSVLEVDKFFCGQVQYSCTFIDGTCGETAEIKLLQKEIVPEEEGNLFDLAPKIAAATADVPVLALGDLFFSFFKTDHPGSEFFWPSRFFNTSCELLFQPPQQVLDQAAGFIEEYIGGDYASIHLRRTDFLGHSHRMPNLRYWPLQAVAECTSSKMVQLNLTILFVSSDAPDEEVEVFKELLQSQASLARARGQAWSIVVVRLPKELNLQPAQRAMVDKLVAAHAVVTMITDRSTFSHHIGYLRESLGLASCHDGHICDSRDKEAVNIKWRQ
ncbi:unnamed protein product [Closterium sp. NIES-54]